MKWHTVWIREYGKSKAGKITALPWKPLESGSKDYCLTVAKSVYAELSVVVLPDGVRPYEQKRTKSKRSK